MNSKHIKFVYFVRHGQSVDNALPVFQAIDSPLSDKGRYQAATIAERLSTVSFDVLLSSPVQRAKETAEYISKKTQKDIVISDLFVERIKPSETNGKPWSDNHANEVWRAWEESLYNPKLRVSDGENYEDIIVRVDKALGFLVNRPESTLAVVTHGYFLRALIARVLIGDSLNGVIMKQFQDRASMENTGITVLEYAVTSEDERAWRLWTYNDHSHFAE